VRTPSQTPSARDRLFGGLLGAVVGDALGLPHEGAFRSTLDAEPVEGMQGGGPHGCPAGAWSDDGSLLLCLADSLCSGYDPEDVARSFLAWWQEGLWTPYGRPFGYGYTVASAMYAMTVGVPPLQAGQRSEASNGNGSLMRTLPIALCLAGDHQRMLTAAHEVSSITHAHPRSLMCCGIYCLVASLLLEGMDAAQAVRSAAGLAAEHYRGSPWDVERPHLGRLLSGKAAELDREQVRSSGYVVETLEAAFWCLLRSGSFREAALLAVNLGDDTDTTACVTAGLAGILYGRASMPDDWVSTLVRSDDIVDLCGRFWDAVNPRRPR